MKYEILKICVLLIVFLVISFVLAYQFKSIMLPADRYIQTFLSEKHLKVLTFSDVKQYVAQMTELVAKSVVLKISLIILSAALMLAMAGRAFYQKQVRIKRYQKLTALQQKIHHWRDSEAADIDPAIANLTALQAQLTEQSAVTSMQLPMFYALRGEVDSALNHLKNKKQLLVNEALVLAKAKRLAHAENLKQTQHKLVHHADYAPVAEAISATTLEVSPAVNRAAHGHFTRVLAWKRYYQATAISENQDQPQPLLAEIKPMVLTETATTPALAAQPNSLVQSINKIKGFGFWPHKAQDNACSPADTTSTEQAQVTPVVQTPVDDAMLATAAPLPTLAKSFSKFFSFGAGKKSPTTDDEDLPAQEQLHTLSTHAEANTSVDADVDGGNQHQQALGIVRKHMLAGMALSTVPVPFLDVACLTGTQLNLLNNLSAHYGMAFNKERGKSILVAMLSGSLPTTMLMWLSSMSKAIPGIGTLSGGISLSATAGAVIYATGQVFIKHLEDGGGLDNFDGKQQREHFQQALKDGLATHAK
ncbi:YcjF family protein [Crenothrix polyspora]|nr:DUF697 domain-containing protein [Crenothrix polyspora]